MIESFASCHLPPSSLLASDFEPQPHARARSLSPEADARACQQSSSRAPAPESRVAPRPVPARTCLISGLASPLDGRTHCECACLASLLAPRTPACPSRAQFCSHSHSHSLPIRLRLRLPLRLSIALRLSCSALGSGSGTGARVHTRSRSS